MDRQNKFRLARIIIFLILVITIIQLYNTNKNLKSTVQKLEQSNINFKTKIDSIEIKNKDIQNIKKKIMKIGWNVKDNYATELAVAIDYHSKKYNIDKNLLISIAYIESGFEKYAKSSVGCLGYFQINPNAHKINKSIIYDADYQTELGCQIFLQKLKIFNGNQFFALNSYNGWASKSNPYANKVLRAKSKLDKIRI